MSSLCRLWFAAILLLIPAAAPGAAVPAELASDLEAVPGAEATQVVDGDTLMLADGREVRLVGIQAPKLPLGRAGFEAWPLAEEARALLAELTLGRHLDLGFGGRRGDRQTTYQLTHARPSGAKRSRRWNISQRSPQRSISIARRSKKAATGSSTSRLTFENI
jgi:endonuclease YncB( thermonuclease family)